MGTFWEFADKHTDGLWVLAVIAIVALCVIVDSIASAFRGRK